MQAPANTTLAAVLVVVAVASGGVGFGLAEWLRPAPPTPEPAPAAAPAAAPRPDPREHRVVYRYRDECECDEAAESEDASLRDAYEWCAAQLMACEARANVRREEWPDDSPFEAPDRWSEVVSAALAECDVGLPLRMTECSEYPCVAVLDSGRGSLRDREDSDAVEQLAAQATERLRACPTLQRELGTEDLDELVHVVSYDTGCGVALGILAAPAGSDLARAIADEPWDQLLRWYYRRGADIEAAWECEREPSDPAPTRGGE